MLTISIAFPVDAISNETIIKSQDYITNNGLGLSDKLEKTISLNEDNLTKRYMIESFCREVLSHGKFQGELLGGKIVNYDPSQSMFLYIVCNTYIGGEKFPELFTQTDDAYLKPEGRTLRDLNLICDVRTWDDIGNIRQPIGCVPGCETASMNECDFSLLMPHLLEFLFNDLSNVGLSMIYGLMGIPDPGVGDSTLANRFAVRYFSTILCDKEWWTCLYPKTHQKVRNDIKNAKKLAKKTSIINTEALMTQAAKDGWCSNPENPDDLWGCVFASNNIVLLPIVDTMFNEMYYFQLLMAYYKSFLTNSPYIGEFAVGADLRNSRLEKTAEEIERINLETTRTLQAVLITNRMLMQTQAYYPLHVWLQTYNEAIVSFRNDLAKVFQPLHQLMFKLINVQKTND